MPPESTAIVIPKSSISSKLAKLSIPIILFLFSTFYFDKSFQLPLSISSWQDLQLNLFTKSPPINSNSKWILNPPPPLAVREITLEVAWQILSPDGVEKKMITINGQFPGPTIEARQGEKVKITLINSLDESTSGHWHGLRLPNQYDGVPGLTQCPIAPGQKRIYEFEILNDPGTYWYHSHMSTQRADGWYGAFIVHPAEETKILHEDLRIRGGGIMGRSTSNAEVETEDRVMLIGDWYHRGGQETLDFYHSMRSNGNEPVPDNTLTNSEQLYDCEKMLGDFKCDGKGKLPQYNLNSNKLQKLRLINSGSLAIVYFSVDNHTLEIVEADGSALTSVFVRELSIAAGQRYAIILRPDSQDFVGKEFKFHTRLSQDCFSYRNPALDKNKYGIFSYSSTKLLAPISFPTAISQVVEFNALELYPLIESGPLPSTDREDLHLYVTTQSKVSSGRIPFGFVNNTSWQPTPNNPLLAFTPEQRIAKAWGKNQLVIPIETNGNVTHVDLIINNLEDGTHPFHLHGFSFYPLYSFESTIGLGSYPWWKPPVLPTRMPALRDTFLIPIRGHIIIRVPFLPNYSGYHLLHCHVLMHSATGMAAIFEVDGNLITDEQRSIAGESCLA